MAEEKWMQKAFKPQNRGELHRWLYSIGAIKSVNQKLNIATLEHVLARVRKQLNQLPEGSAKRDKVLKRLRQIMAAINAMRVTAKRK